MTRFSDLYGEYRYEPYLEWFMDDKNIPIVYMDIGEKLKLQEEGQERKYEELQDYLESTMGKLNWHMFCKVAYDYPLRDDHDSMGAINVIKDINSMPNPIFDNDRVKELLVERKALGKPIIDEKMSPLFGRLFNYYHCYLQGRLPLFRLRPLTNQRNTCPACGCIFSAKGFVQEKPTVSVNAREWDYADALEDGGSNIRQETKV